MNTTIKNGVPAHHCPVWSFYSLEHLDNGAELGDLIKKAEERLSSCPFCGHPKPSIRHQFVPEAKEPHRMYVWCCGKDDMEGVSPCGCWNRTFEYNAADTLEDFIGTLEIIISQWNRRPGQPLWSKEPQVT